MSYYLEKVFDVPRLVDGFRRHVLATGVSPDVLVGTGVSGTVAVSILGSQLNIPFVVVRKEGVRCHSSRALAGDFPACASWLFVDDLIDSGATLRRVKKIIKTYTDASKLLGAFLYQNQEDCVFIPERRLYDKVAYAVRASTMYPYEYLKVDGTWTPGLNLKAEVERDCPGQVAKIYKRAANAEKAAKKAPYGNGQYIPFQPSTLNYA